MHYRFYKLKDWPQKPEQQQQSNVPALEIPGKEDIWREWQRCGRPRDNIGRGGPSPSSLSSSDGISTTRETEAKLVQKPPGVPKSGVGLIISSFNLK